MAAHTLAGLAITFVKHGRNPKSEILLHALFPFICHLYCHQYMYMI